MAETIISPGVFTRENDISFIAPAPVAAGAAIIGPTVKGPVETPTIVTSYNDFTRKFGVTFNSGSHSYEYLTSLAVKNYFQQGGNSVVVARVVSSSADWSSATSTAIYAGSKESGNLALASMTISANTTDATDATYTNVPLTGSGVGDGAQATVVVEDNAVSSVVITSAGANYAIGDTLTIWSASLGASSTNVSLTGLTAANIVNSQPFTVATIGKGVIYNNSTSATSAGAQNSDGSLVSGSSDNLRWEISNVNNAKGTFTLSVRQGDDSRKNKVVLETFNNLSLDPNSPNYIEKVIGNQVVSLPAGSTQVTVTGNYVNRSNYIRIASVNLPTLNYLGIDGVTIGSDSAGENYSGSLPSPGSGSFYDGTGTNYGSTGASDFFSSISSTNTQGLTPEDYNNIITLLGNKDDYAFNVISAPGLVNNLHSTQVDNLISLAESRGDCIAVVDLYAYGATVSNTVGQADTLNSSYAAAYWPWVQMQSATGKLEWCPASTVIPGIYAFTDGAAAPWYAPAGLTRGGVTGVIQAEKRLSKADRDTLYDGKVNPIATFPGAGIAVFGQKTLQTKASALDRVNVRRLLIELKKFIGDQANTLVFEQNTIATRNRFLAAVNPYLESVTSRNGLYAYRVIMDDSNNTADVIDRNQLVGQIYIQPAKTAEFIVLDFVVQPTGATFEG